MFGGDALLSLTTASANLWFFFFLIKSQAEQSLVTSQEKKKDRTAKPFRKVKFSVILYKRQHTRRTHALETKGKG